MIQQAFNGMITLMLAKFVLNDAPHALGLDNPVKTMGHFGPPPERPRKHPPEPIGRAVIVPGGSRWRCTKCGRMLEAGEKAVRLGGKVYCVECARGGNPGHKYPVAWDIRLEHPDVNSPKWEDYKRLVEHFKRRELRGRGAPGTGTIIIENVPTWSMVEELTSLIRSHGLKVFDVVAVERVPESKEEEE